MAHRSRIGVLCIDCQTDDQEAERERLEALGARVVSRVKRWIVMEAPTGHRFCLVNPQGDDWPGEAKVHGEVQT